MIYNKKSTHKGKIEISSKQLYIENSYDVSRYKRILISKIYKNTVDSAGNKLTNRSVYSLAAEWAGHNLLAKLHIDEGSTEHVNLDSKFHNNKWYTEVGTVLLMILGVL